MFFSITNTPKINFPCHYSLDRIKIFTDSGWNIGSTLGSTYLYKGYADTFDLAQNIGLVIAQNTPKFTGNFCVIHHDHSSGQIHIKSDIWRSFPIFLHDHEITNLEQSSKVAWTDSVITVDQDFKINENKIDVIGDIVTDTLDLQQAIVLIDKILQNKTKKFLSHNKLPIKVHLSGGVDSMLVFSLLEANSQNYEIIKARHFDYDEFWLANDTQIRQAFWAYNQLHHWVDPCVLTSGAPGDEFMLRSPVTIDQFLKYRGQSIMNLISVKQDCLHLDYFSQKKHTDIFRNQSVNKDLSIKDFYWHLCNMVINDWQHWHLGNTLTWTPLRDLEIFKILLRLSTAHAIDQILDSKISKLLIEKNVPNMSKLISDQKNSTNPMKNLSDWLFKNPR